jgi:hypothetical protein
MIEFVEQESVVPALKLNNKQLGENTIKYINFIVWDNSY